MSPEEFFGAAPASFPAGASFSLGEPPGKAVLSAEEAADLAETLDRVLAPISEGERAVEDHACLRELESGPFPILVRLRERLGLWLAGAPEDEAMNLPGPRPRGPDAPAPEDAGFELSRGELEVLEKAVACAESLGRGERVLRTVAWAGAGTALALLLFV